MKSKNIGTGIKKQIIPRKQHLRTIALKRLDFIEKFISPALSAEYRKLCKIVLNDKLTTKEYTGFISAISLFTRKLGVENGK